MASGTQVVERGTNQHGHLIRLQKRRGAFDVIYNSTGIASGWRYRIKGVSEESARNQFALETMRPGK